MAFDEFGNLTPYQKLEYTAERAESEFVESFAPENGVRKGLWANLAAYNGRVRSLIGSGWEQWLGGSFVTKKQDPEDIDAINLIEYSEQANQKLGENPGEMDFLFATLEGQKSSSWNNLKIDGYLIPIYPKHHPLYRRSQMELSYWSRALCMDEKTGLPKGFISIFQG